MMKSARFYKTFLVATLKLPARLLTGTLILLVRVYQHTLSYVFPSACRYDPSCSVYAIAALRKHGPLKGSWMAMRRIGRCHPYSKHPHYDPV